MKGITLESRDELVYYLFKDIGHAETILINTPLISPPPDLAAKWQDRTRGGYEFEVFAERKGDLYGLCHFNGGLLQTAWTRQGTSTVKKEFDLIPRSKHSELIVEAKHMLDTPSDHLIPAIGVVTLIRKLIAALEQEHP